MTITPPTEPQHDTVMDVIAEQIARVYAQAFLGAASKTDDAAGHVEELQSLVTDVVGRFPALGKVLGSAFISQEEKEGLLDRAFAGRASPLLVNFLKVLSQHERLDILRAIARQASQQYRQQIGRHDVLVRTAVPLDESLREEITRRLRKALSGEPHLHELVEPELIAGFIVRVGDTVFDGSVRTRLEQIRRAMVERAVERIETKPETFLKS